MTDSTPSPQERAAQPPTTGPGGPAPGAQPEAEAPTHGFNSRGKVRTTRAGAWWTALVVVALVSIAFLVFIAQNAEAVTITFLGLEGDLSLAVALLLSAALGALVVAVPGIVRITQLRRALTKNHKER